MTTVTEKPILFDGKCSLAYVECDCKEVITREGFYELVGKDVTCPGCGAIIRPFNPNARQAL